MKEQQWLEDGWFYHSHAWHLLHEFLKLIREVKDAETLLDVGAGTGIAAAVIQAVFPDMQCYVTDIEKECHNFWKKRGLIGLITNNIFYYVKKDIIISSHVIEHIDESKIHDFILNLFNQTFRRLIIAVPDGDVHFYDHKIIFNRSKLYDIIHESLDGESFKYKSYAHYHPHINNLIAVIDK
jgi:SAM-dependent methyltransferase